MFEKTITETTARKADETLQSVESAADQALSSVGNAIDKGVDRMREATHQMRDGAQRATEGTSNYIRHDPIKAVLMAAATGAALMALLSLLTRSNGRG